jgi:hypothetical protein
MPFNQDTLASIDIYTLAGININNLESAKAFYLDRFILFQRLLDDVDGALPAVGIRLYADSRATRVDVGD